MVVAHPSVIRVTVDGLKYIAKQEGVPVSSLYTPSSPKYNNNTDFGHLNNQKLLLEYFIKTFETISGCKLSGLEMYHPSCFDSKIYTQVEKVCKEHDMYVSCGSDYHGEHLHTDRSLGNVFHNAIQESYINECDPTSTENFPIYVSNISAVQHFFNQKISKEVSFADSEGNPISLEEVNKAFKVFHTKPEDIKYKQKMNKILSTLDISKRIEELVSVADRFASLNSTTNARKKAKIMLKLNLFVESIIGGVNNIRKIASKHQYIRSLEEYANLVALLKKIRKSYFELLKQHPDLVRDLKEDMEYYYSRRKLALADLVNIQPLPPTKSKKDLEKD